MNEQDTSFLDCKHKHMMISGAPPNSRSLVPSVTCRTHDFTSRIDF